MQRCLGTQREHNEPLHVRWSTRAKMKKQSNVNWQVNEWRKWRSKFCNIDNMMKLKENIVGEINHSQLNKYCRIPHTQGISKSQAGRRRK